MALVLTNGSTGLFDHLGKLFKVAEQLNTCAGTTVPGYVNALITAVEAGLPTNAIIVNGANGVAAGNVSWQTGTTTLSSPLQQLAQNLVIEMVNASNPLQTKDLPTALAKLVTIIQGAGTLTAPTDNVLQNVVGTTTSAGSTNNGNGTLVISNKRYDGRTNENFIPETLLLTCTSATPTAGSTGQPAATFTVKGIPAVANRLLPTWPGGSGANTSLQTTVPTTGLLTNGGFETQATMPGLPDGWIAYVGTPGTNFKLTTNEVQTVVIGSTPTSGYYELKYTNGASKIQTTLPIVYNAPSTTVQAALRLLTGLEQLTIVQTGTTPNFTHTITFAGVGGNVAQLTSNNYTDVGTITHGTTTGGDTQVYRGGSAFEILGDGSTLQEIRQTLVNPPAQTPLAFNMLASMSATAAGGVLAVDLYDGSATINDDAGTANSISQNVNTLTTSWSAITGTFRLPRVVPPVVQLRIRVSTAITNTKNLFLDEASLVRMTPAYPDGPYMASFAGSSDFALNDAFSIVVTNTYAGKIQTWCDKFFQMREKGLLMPSTSAGGTIPDALVA